MSVSVSRGDESAQPRGVYLRCCQDMKLQQATKQSSANRVYPLTSIDKCQSELGEVLTLCSALHSRVACSRHWMLKLGLVILRHQVTSGAIRSLPARAVKLHQQPPSLRCHVTARRSAQPLSYTHSHTHSYSHTLTYPPTLIPTHTH